MVYEMYGAGEAGVGDRGVGAKGVGLGANESILKLTAEIVAHICEYTIN